MELAVVEYGANAVVRGGAIALELVGANELRRSGVNAVVERGAMALVEGGANAVEKDGSIPMMAGGAWMWGASEGRETDGEEGRLAVEGSSQARKSSGISGNTTPYFASRYSPMPSNSSLTDGREPTFT